MNRVKGEWGKFGYRVNGMLVSREVYVAAIQQNARMRKRRKALQTGAFVRPWNAIRMLDRRSAKGASEGCEYAISVSYSDLQNIIHRTPVRTHRVHYADGRIETYADGRYIGVHYED